MALRITKSTDVIEVKTLVVCAYGPPGVGKTTLANTAEKCLVLDFDRGSHRSRNRGDTVLIEKWDDAANITAEDLAPYRTLAVDTTGRALDVLAADIIKSNPKMARGGALSLQGFGELKSKFVAWTKMIRSFGLDIILIAHSDEQKNGDDLVERLDMQGGSKTEVYKVADLMGRVYIHNGKRMLNFSPTDTAFGKNPAQLPPLDVPHYDAEPRFLAGVIAAAKESLNAMTAAQAAFAAQLADWKAKIDAAADVDAFNALLDPIKGADESVRDNAKRLLVQAAKAKGLAFNKATGKFEGTAPKDGAATNGAAAAAPTSPSPADAKPTGSASEPAPASPAKAETPPAREPGADDDEDAAARKAAEPTPEEIAKLGEPSQQKAAAKKGRAA